MNERDQIAMKQREDRNAGFDRRMDFPVNPDSKGPIEIGLNEVHHQLDLLNETITRLHGRLQPALLPESSETGKDATESTPLMSPVAQNLHDIMRRVRRYRTTIDNLISRLEL